MDIVRHAMKVLGVEKTQHYQMEGRRLAELQWPGKDEPWCKLFGPWRDVGGDLGSMVLLSEADRSEAGYIAHAEAEATWLELKYSYWAARAERAHRKLGVQRSAYYRAKGHEMCERALVYSRSQVPRLPLRPWEALRAELIIAVESNIEAEDKVGRDNNEGAAFVMMWTTFEREWSAAYRSEQAPLL